MAAVRARLVLPAVLALCLLSSAASSVIACPFCDEKGPTLLGDYQQATMVLLGKFSNARTDPNGNFGEGTTDFTIESALKTDSSIKDKKRITIPKYIPKTDQKFLIFCDVYKGTIDPYRGVEVPADSVLVEYLKGAMDPKRQSIDERLKYCFKYLNNPEYEIAIDAYREFAKTDYKDYRPMAKKLTAKDADTLASWLRDPKTPPFRYGLYASLLGHCGKEEHAKLLREMLDDPQKRTGSGIDGMLAAYTMLKPADGWAHLKQILGNEKEDFLMRYAALRTVRFFWENTTDLTENKKLDKKDMVQGLCLLLNQSDIGDFAIEDLRKWQRWETTEQVLELFDKKSHDVTAMKRAILRFALTAEQHKHPAQEKAKKFVERMRRLDSEWVNDTAELLKLENEPTQPKPPTPGKSK
jgi:hypothetical protein